MSSVFAKVFKKNYFDTKDDPSLSFRAKIIISEKVNRSLAETLFKQLLISVPASFLCAFLVFIGLYQTNRSLVLTWFLANLVIFLIRLLLYSRYHNDAKNLKLLLTFFISTALINAILWGMAGSLLMPINDLEKQMIIIIILAGIVSGSAHSLQGNLVASVLFVLISIIPLDIWLFLQYDMSDSLLGVAVFAYLIFMLLLCWNGYNLMHNALSLYFENEFLMKNLAVNNKKLQFEISEHEKAQQKINYLATHDSLTHLFNRNMLNTLFEKSLTRAQRYNEKLAVLYIDIDNFKNINDQWGHELGDQFLKNLAQRLCHAVRDTDSIIRLGGDEFIMIIENVTSSAAVKHIVEKILKQLSPPFVCGDVELTETVSVGISVYPDDGVQRDELLKKADMALYMAKNSGKNGYCFYEQLGIAKTK